MQVISILRWRKQGPGTKAHLWFVAIMTQPPPSPQQFCLSGTRRDTKDRGQSFWLQQAYGSSWAKFGNLNITFSSPDLLARLFLRLWSITAVWSNLTSHTEELEQSKWSIIDSASPARRSTQGSQIEAVIIANTMHFVRLCVYLVWLEDGLVEVWGGRLKLPQPCLGATGFPGRPHCRLRRGTHSLCHQEADVLFGHAP